MADASDTMRYLVKNFDIAPAGTREEGQVAKGLSEVFHEHGLETANKSFRYSSLGKVPYAALAILMGIAAVLAGMGGVVAIVMLVIGILIAAALVLEHFGVPTVSRIGASGSSQNVVARHPSSMPSNGRKVRPVVVIAHYDTPRADVFGLPFLAFLQPYLRMGVTVCMAADLVCILFQVLPLPTVLHSIAWAVSIVASVLLLVWGVCAILHRFAMPFTSGANNNKAAVAALFGLLDRVRPLQGGPGFGPSDELYEAMENESGALVEQEADEQADRVRVTERRPRSRGTSASVSGAIVWDGGQDNDEQVAVRPRRRSSARPAEPAAVRYGEEVVRSLGILPASCVIEYEDASKAAEDAAEVPAAGQVHRVSAQTMSENAEVVGGETIVMTPAGAASASEGAADAVATGEVAPAPAEDVVEIDPNDKDAVADAIMAGIVGANTLSGSQAPASEDAPAAEAGATSLMAPVAAAPQDQPAQPAPAAQPAPRRPFRVITSSDDYDAELREGSAVVPPDVAAQSSEVASGFFADDVDPEAAAVASVVNDPTWGTSSFRPVTAGRRILGDIPDPAVAAVDPFSVSSIDPMGSYNPEDFSELDFETGTHQAVTPQMLEEEQRRSLNGFGSLMDEPKRARKNKRGGRQGRISQQAARMQAEMQETSFNDWLGLDDGFDAKTNGREIGSWDHFNDDEQAGAAPAQGGSAPVRNPNWQGGAARSRRSTRRDADSAAREERRAAMTLGDRDLIAHEVWFVLTGASEADHAGVKDFLKTYRADLRGAYFINLECVGAGRQSLVLEEGAGRHSKADRRLVNLFGNASLAINRPFALTRMNWRDTEASALLRQGCRAVTVTGVEKGAPANAYWTGDTPEKLDTAMIDDLVDVLVEVIKNA